MKTDLELLQLHKTDSLFFAGKNFGDKVQVGMKGVTKIYYDSDDGLVHVWCGNQETWVKGYMSVNPVWLGSKEVVQKHHPMTAGAAVKAQIGGPQDVFKTAQVETPLDKVQGKPGRKPKYQGEEVK